MFIRYNNVSLSSLLFPNFLAILTQSPMLPDRKLYFYVSKLFLNYPYSKVYLPSALRNHNVGIINQSGLIGGKMGSARRKKNNNDKRDRMEKEKRTKTREAGILE